MRDLESLLNSLANFDRRTLIALLSSEAERSERLAKSMRRRTGAQEEKHRDALRRVAQIGRILHFLRHEVPADGTTDEEWALCCRLTEKLRDKKE
jgi:hypothetical protein